MFLDTNILLELILADRPHYPQVKNFLETTTEVTAISILTAHLVMHFGRKEDADEAFLHAVLNENKMIAVSPEDYQWAANNERGKDFEDALQMAVAVRSRCSTFLTLDMSFAKRYADLPIEIKIPA